MLNVIFDATLLANSFNKNSSRSGLYFVAKNVLDEFLARENLSISLYFPPDVSAEGFRVWRKLYPKVKTALNWEKCKDVCQLYCQLWQWHGKLISHRILRKPFALGIAIIQRAMKLLMKNKIDKKVFLSANIFYSPAYKIPNVVRSFPNIKSFVTLHDAIPMLFPTLSNSTFAYETCESLLESDGVFFVSQHTKSDFEKLFSKIVKCNSRIIPLAASTDFHCVKEETIVERIKRKYEIPNNKRYVFSLCSLAPHKNLVRNLKCFNFFVEKHHIDDLIWIIGGGAFDDFMKEMHSQNIDFNSRYTQYVGYVDDEDLPVLYSNAEWFVYTSQYEGFGLPPLEAMQCGCPVITSNNSSLPEVVGDAGIMIDWDSDEQHIAAYEKYYFDEALRKENSRKGLERAKRFSWEKTANQMIDVMRSV